MKASSYARVFLVAALGWAGGCAGLFRTEAPDVVAATDESPRVKIDGQHWDAQKTTIDQAIAERKSQVERTVHEREALANVMDQKSNVEQPPARPQGSVQVVSHQQQLSDRQTTPPPTSQPRTDIDSPPTLLLPPVTIRTQSAHSHLPSHTPATTRQPPLSSTPPAASENHGRPRVQATASDQQGRPVAILRSPDGQTHVAREGSTILMTLDGQPAALKVENISDGRVLVRHGRESVILQ